MRLDALIRLIRRVEPAARIVREASKPDKPQGSKALECLGGHVLVLSAMPSHDTVSECSYRQQRFRSRTSRFPLTALMMQAHAVAGRVEARPHRDACMARHGCSGLLET